MSLYGLPPLPPDDLEELALRLGPEPEFEDPYAQDFETTPYERLLEGFGRSMQGAQAPRPRNFWEGLAVGGVQGLAQGGQRIAGARQRFEGKQAERAKVVDAARLRATELRRQRTGDIIGKAFDERRRLKSENEKYERDNPKPSPEQLREAPWLARVTDENGRVPRSVLGTAFQPKPERERPSEPLVAIVGPDGKPVLVSRGDALGKTPFSGSAESRATRPSTGEQKQALAFYNRAKGAIDEVYDPSKPGESLEDRIADVANKNPIGAAIGENAWNVFKGSDRQRYEQSVSDFARALLRKESGAAISAKEFADVERDYFVKVGDTPEKVAQKRRARERVLVNLKFQSGPAYEEYYGPSEPAAAAAVGSAQSRSRPPLSSFEVP